MKDIKACHSEKEWRRIKALYDRFVAAYAKTHPKCKYPRAPSWKWVKSHQVHHKTTVTYTVQESKFVNGLLNSCLPRNIDVKHSAVAEAEHLEFIVGKTIRETIHNYEVEAKWWLDRISESKTQEQYIHYVQQYHYLAEVYEKHHVHV